jgi:hypothetical protein
MSLFWISKQYLIKKKVVRQKEVGLGYKENVLFCLLRMNPVQSKSACVSAFLAVRVVFLKSHCARRRNLYSGGIYALNLHCSYAIVKQLLLCK